MNKNELIVFLRDPSKLTSEHLNELEEIIEEEPYFLSAHLLLAKGSKELKDPKTKKRVASAAIYSTDRILLKKYLSSNLFFLGQAVAEESAGTPKTKKEKIYGDHPSGFVFQNNKNNYRISRHISRTFLSKNRRSKVGV